MTGKYIFYFNYRGSIITPGFSDDNIEQTYFIVRMSLFSKLKEVKSESFFAISLLDMLSPVKVSKYQLKLKIKPWITAAIHKSILVKNSLFKKYIKLKDPVKKTETHDKKKYYRNLLSTVIKKIKKNYYNEFFKTNINNIKNTYKGIRNLVSWKQSASPYIHLLSQDNETVSNPKKIVNIFNDYCSTIAEKTKAKDRFQINHLVNFSSIPTKTLSS